MWLREEVRGEALGNLLGGTLATDLHVIQSLGFRVWGKRPARARVSGLEDSVLKIGPRV
jgi:hypothetical protein